MLYIHQGLITLANQNLLQPLINVVVGLAAAFITILAILGNRWSTRMKATLDLLERLETLEYYQNRYQAFRKIRMEPGGIRRMIAVGEGPGEGRLNRDMCLDYLNQYEFIALGIEKHILDEGFFRNTYGPIAVREWHAARPLIEHLRRDNPDYFRAFTRLVRKWDPTIRPVRH
jgi:hypothetical protein